MAVTKTLLPISSLRPLMGKVELCLRLVESLEAGAGYKPLVVRKDGTILRGNHTFAAARFLGFKELECLLAD